MTENTCTILLKKPEFLQLDKISQVLAKAYDETALDGMQKARACWGFLAEHASRELADRITADAKQAGLETIIMPDKLVPALPEPEIVHTANCAGDAFRHNFGTSAEQREVPWNEILLVAAAGLKEDVVTMQKEKRGPSAGQKIARAGIMLATGLPIGMGKNKEVKKEIRSSELFMYLDIYAGNPAGRNSAALSRLRITAQSFNFTYLGGRKQYNIMANFRLLLQDIAQHAAAATQNRGTRTILAGQPVNIAGYQTMGDFEKESRWLLALL